MFVCHCRAVTDGTIRASIDSGACTVEDLAERCGAGTGCGGCHVALRQLLAEANLQQPLPAYSPCFALRA